MKKTTKREWPAIQATSAKTRDAISLATKIAERLQAYAKAANEGHGDWATHGTICEVRERLRELADFLEIPGVNNTVAQGHGCPRCYEHQADFLQVADNDPTQVTCLCCNQTYRLS